MCVSLPRPLSLEQPHLCGRHLGRSWHPFCDRFRSISETEARHTGPLAVAVSCHINRLLG